MISCSRNLNGDVAGGDHSDELVVVADRKCPNIEFGHCPRLIEASD
jgi:hypothetical protein